MITIYFKNYSKYYKKVYVQFNFDLIEQILHDNDFTNWIEINEEEYISNCKYMLNEDYDNLGTINYYYYKNSEKSIKYTCCNNCGSTTLENIFKKNGIFYCNDCYKSLKKFI
jgi:formamidopyrimidine-DNA glycosylase